MELEVVVASAAGSCGVGGRDRGSRGRIEFGWMGGGGGLVFLL